LGERERGRETKMNIEGKEIDKDVDYVSSCYHKKRVWKNRAGEPWCCVMKRSVSV
jgi:hypothetical protein